MVQKQNNLTKEEEKFAIIWDQTGVLFKNGRDYVQKSFQKVFDKYNINLPSTCFDEKYRGTSLKNQIQMWEKDFNIKFPLTNKEFSVEAGKFQFELLKENIENEKDENLMKLLKELKAKNVPMAMSTSSTKTRAEELTKILGQDKYLDAIITAEDVRNHEPETDSLELTAKKLGVPLHRCVVIEDGALGLKTAKRAGCKTVGFVAHGEKQEKAIRKEGADLFIKDFNELNYDIIKELFNEGCSYFEGY